jgi:hypothetical protein
LISLGSWILAPGLGQGFRLHIQGATVVAARGGAGLQGTASGSAGLRWGSFACIELAILDRIKAAAGWSIQLTGILIPAIL